MKTLFFLAPSTFVLELHGSVGWFKAVLAQWCTVGNQTIVLLSKTAAKESWEILEKATCRSHRKALKSRFRRKCDQWPGPLPSNFSYTNLVIFYEDDMLSIFLGLLTVHIAYKFPPFTSYILCNSIKINVSSIQKLLVMSIWKNYSVMWITVLHRHRGGRI